MHSSSSDSSLQAHCHWLPVWPARLLAPPFVLQPYKYTQISPLDVLQNIGNNLG